jgi:hypothetical protein
LAIAAGLTMTQLPWTQLVMVETNKRLIAIADSKGEQEKTSQEGSGRSFETVVVDEFGKRESLLLQADWLVFGR